MRALIDKFFRNYLTERDLEKTLENLTDNVITIGTGEQEIGRGKEGFRQLLLQELEELPEPMKYEIFDYMEMECGENVHSVLAQLRVELEMEEGTFELQTRLTSTAVKFDDGWKICSLHMSTPTQEQEQDSFFPLYYGKNAKGALTAESDAMLMDLIKKSLPGGIMGGFLEEGFPLYVINEKMLEILGCTYEELKAATGEKMLNTIYEEDRGMVEESIAQQFGEKQEYEVEYRAVGKGGKLIWINDIGKKVITEDGREAMISIMTDISDRVQRENQLKTEAEHDNLTMLYNRKKAVCLIEEYFQQADGGHFFICDVDNFKSVNDTKGHAVGDEVLIKLAQIIKSEVGPDTIAARLGGDEYILFFPAKLDRSQVVRRIEAIQTNFREYMMKLIPQLDVSISAGGAERTDKQSVRTLYDEADSALYRAKERKNRWEIYGE